MIPKEIDGATHHFGAPKDWDVSEHGECHTLAVRVGPDTLGSGPLFQSAWELSEQELTILRQGGSVILTVFGMQPAVALHVEPLAYKPAKPWRPNEAQQETPSRTTDAGTTGTAKSKPKARQAR